MLKLISFILICLATINCNSQKMTKPSSIEESGKYFLGTWYFTQKNYEEEGEMKNFPLHKCMKEYTLTFLEDNGSTFLIKEFATGSNCATKSNSGKLKVQIGSGIISYFEEDLKKIEQYKIYSKTKFSIVYRDIINGKVTEIEDVYERRK